jgi:hypothetical protein
LFPPVDRVVIHGYHLILPDLIVQEHCKSLTM